MKHNWEYRPFDRVAHTITPISKIEKSEYLTCGLVPIISQEETVISGYWNNSNDVTPHQKPVVIFGDHSRVLKYIDFEFVVGADGVKIIEPKEDINTKFLYYYLHWLNIPSLGYARHFKLVKEALYAVPPKKIQEQIVAELDKINELIEKNRELLHQLDSLAQSLFYDTFGDPITNPEGWEESKLIDCIADGGSISYGIVQPGDDYPNGVPVVRPIDLTGGKAVTCHYLKIVDPAISNSYKRTILLGNEILMCVRGTTGIIRMADISLKDANVTRGITPLRIKDAINVTYMYEYLKCNKAQEFIKYYTKGTTLKQINMADLRNLPVILPPKELQNQFASKVEAIEEQKAAVEKSIAELQTLLDSRMDYWFN